MQYFQRKFSIQILNKDGLFVRINISCFLSFNQLVESVESNATTAGHLPGKLKSTNSWLV